MAPPIMPRPGLPDDLKRRVEALEASVPPLILTPRMIWGQEFDGTADVDGDITVNGAAEINGDVAVDGQAEFTGDVNANDFVLDGVGGTPPTELSAPIEVQDEGVSLTLELALLNFVGPGVSLSHVGGNVEVDIAHTFSTLVGKPTTIGGYGITDFNSLGDARWSPLGHTHSFASLTGKPTTLAGYGIVDADVDGDLNVDGDTHLTGPLTADSTGDFGDDVTAPDFVLGAGSGAPDPGASAPIEVRDEGVTLTSELAIIDITGPGAQASVVGGTVTINVPHTWSTLVGKPTTIGGFGITDFDSLGDARWSLLSHTHTFAALTSKPTTIAGYGITDFNSLGDARWSLLGHTHTFASLTSKPTTVSGYGITDLVASLVGSYLPLSSGDGILAATKKLFLDGGGNTYLLEDTADRIRFVAGGAVSMDLTTTYLYSWHDILLDAGKRIYLDGGSDTYIYEASNNVIAFAAGGTNRLIVSGAEVNVQNLPLIISATERIYLDGGGDTFLTEIGADNIAVYTGNIQRLRIAGSPLSGGGVAVLNSWFGIDAGQILYLDGGTDTYIMEGSGDRIDFVAGGLLGVVINALTTSVGIRNDYHLTITSGKKFFFDDLGDTYLYESAANLLRMYVGGTNTLWSSASAVNVTVDLVLAAAKLLYLDGGSNTYLYEASADEINAVCGATTHLWISDVYGGVSVRAGKKLGLDSMGNTYFIESSADVIKAFAGGTERQKIDSSGTTSTDFILA